MASVTSRSARVRPLIAYLFFYLIYSLAMDIATGAGFSGLYFTLEPEENVYPLKREPFVWGPCQAGGDLPINITWERDGVVVNDPRRHVLPDGSLYFSSVDGRRHRNPDEGDYACIIRNEHGALRSRTVRLTIPRIGLISLEPMVQTAIEGDVVRFYCSLNESTPHVNYSWQKDRKFIFSNDKYLLLPQGVLQIHGVSARDIGLYRCMAENVARRLRTDEEAVLQVLPAHSLNSGRAPTPLTTLPPAILSEAHNFTVLENQNIILECLVSRRPGEEINVDWYFIRDGKETIEVISDPLQMIWDNLLLNLTTADQTGVYWCTASSQDTNLTSISEPSLVLVEAYPMFTVTPEDDLKYLPAKSARLNCAAVGFPQPEIRFYKNGRLISIEGRYRMHVYRSIRETHLMFNDIRESDNGLYQCEASNNAGSVLTASKITILPGGLTSLQRILFLFLLLILLKSSSGFIIKPEIFVCL